MLVAHKIIDVLRGANKSLELISLPNMEHSTLLDTGGSETQAQALIAQGIEEAHRSDVARQPLLVADAIERAHKFDFGELILELKETLPSGSKSTCFTSLS